MMPCGTPAAYKRHYVAGEKPCEPCKVAHRHYKRVHARGGKKIIRKRETIVDVLTTHDRWMTTDVLVDWVTELHPDWNRKTVARMLWKLRDEGLLQSREVEWTYSDTYSRASYRPGRMQAVRSVEWRADERAWEALDVVA